MFIHGLQKFLWTWCCYKMFLLSWRISSKQRVFPSYIFTIYNNDVQQNSSKNRILRNRYCHKGVSKTIGSWSWNWRGRLFQNYIKNPHSIGMFDSKYDASFELSINWVIDINWKFLGDENMKWRRVIRYKLRGQSGRNIFILLLFKSRDCHLILSKFVR